MHSDNPNHVWMASKLWQFDLLARCFWHVPDWINGFPLYILHVNYSNLIGWATCMLSMLITIIIKYAKVCMHCVYRKTFWPACVQLVLLGTIFPNMPVVAQRQQLRKQKVIYQVSLEWWSPRLLQSNPTGRTFSTLVQHNHVLVMVKLKCCYSFT